MPTSNYLLASLPDADLGLFSAHLRKSHFDQRKVLIEAGEEVSQAYFPTTLIISLVIGLSSGEFVETAMVGRDGVVGASAALGGRLSLTRAVVQISGEALTCDLDALRAAALRSKVVSSLLVRHEQTVLAQAQQSTGCMAAHAAEARLCRWLLRACDLTDSESLAFTQEYLAQMLGVSRSTVSMVAHTLQQAGLIKYSRGRIQITNLEGLRESSCECHETVRLHYDALVGKLLKA